MIDDKEEKEYLAIPFYIIIHGGTVDLTPITLGVYRGLFREEKYFLFWWYNENLYYNIVDPTIEDLEELENFEINTPTPLEFWNNFYRQKNKR